MRLESLNNRVAAIKKELSKGMYNSGMSIKDMIPKAVLRKLI